MRSPWPKRRDLPACPWRLRERTWGCVADVQIRISRLAATALLYSQVYYIRSSTIFAGLLYSQVLQPQLLWLLVDLQLVDQ